MKHHPVYEHYEKCFAKHGDTPQGVDWPNQEDLTKRFEVMLDVIRYAGGWDPSTQVSLLDFGCGTAKLVDHIKANYDGLDTPARDRPVFLYTGVDISQKFVAYCKKKYSLLLFDCFDIIQCPHRLDKYDYIISNGVFNMRAGLSFEDMLDFFKKTVTILWSRTQVALAFNVMSKQVDWERDDLFHLPLDTLADFLCKEISRNFVIRSDYGLYEYTVYLLR